MILTLDAAASPCSCHRLCVLARIELQKDVLLFQQKQKYRAICGEKGASLQLDSSVRISLPTPAELRTAGVDPLVCCSRVRCYSCYCLR